jgi:putative peptidoglycan lipid II flippase
MGRFRWLHDPRATRALSGDTLKLEGGSRRPQGRSPFRRLAYARRVKADQAARTEPAPARRLAWSTAIFSAATGLSRIFGLVREIVAKNYFGVQGPINAFEIAFLIPNTVRALVADSALSGAFVPVFGELLEKGNRARAWRVASTLFWLMLAGLGTLTVLFLLLAPWLMAPFPYEQDLLVALSRILFPVVLLLGLSGIVVGILNSYEHFTVPALTPVVWNAVIILGLVIGVPQVESEEAKLYVYAGAVLAGTAVQFLLPLPWLRNLDGRLQLVLDWRDPAVRRVFILMFPVTLALGLINVNALIDALFAAKLIDPNIAPSAINAAFRIYMLPQGIFSVAVATVLFPRMARLAARADLDGFRETVSVGLRQIGFLLLPASAVFAVLAEPIVRLSYERGAFTPHQTTVVAGALAAFALGLTFNGTMLLLNRAFFSLQSPWVPTAIALGNLGLNALLDWVFYRFGVWGIPLATSFVNIAGTAALLLVLRRRTGRIGGARLVDSYLRIAIASALAAGAAFGVWYGLDAVAGRSLGGQIVSVGGGMLASVGVFLLFARVLRIRELDALLSLRRRAGTTG